MRNTKGDVHRDKTGRVITNQVAESAAYTAEQRETLRLGLRVLAKIISRAHLRRQAERSAASPGLSPMRKPGRD